MLSFTHLDGPDVLVFDDRGHQVPVLAVRLEPGLAVVSVGAAALGWIQDLLQRAPHETLEGAVRSARDAGHWYHSGRCASHSEATHERLF